MTFWQCFGIIDVWMILLVFYYGIYRQGGSPFYFCSGFRQEMIHEVTSVLREEKMPWLYAMLSGQIKDNVWTTVYTIFEKQQHEQRPICIIYIFSRKISAEFLDQTNWVSMEASIGNQQGIERILVKLRGNITTYNRRLKAS